jgi:hypothetical protein
MKTSHHRSTSVTFIHAQKAQRTFETIGRTDGFLITLDETKIEKKYGHRHTIVINNYNENVVASVTPSIATLIATPDQCRFKSTLIIIYSWSSLTHFIFILHICWRVSQFNKIFTYLKCLITPLNNYSQLA